MKTEFPDWADQEFLAPTLHIGGGESSSNGQQKEDLYLRIERRLSEYRKAEGPKSGLTTENRSHLSGLGNPFGGKTTSSKDKLNKPSTSGRSF